MMKQTWNEWLFDEHVGTADCTSSWNTDHHYDAIASYIGAKAICPAKKPRVRIAPTNPACKPHPKKVIFSGPATTILWKDGTKTTVKCQDEDVWDDEVGIAMCYLKKLLGNKGNFNNIFREAMKVADVREKSEELSSTEGRLSLYEAALKNLNKKWNEAMKSISEEK